MAQIVLDRVTKIFDGSVIAVKDANLSIADEEFVVIVGPSGCGKTTTLRMIAGLEEITEGTIMIGDRIVNNIPPKDRDIAMVFQNYALYPHMTVYQNMAFGLKLRKLPKAQIKQSVEDAAKMLDIEKLLKRRPKALSGGQRQRVALGRAIVRKPKAFLFDEPLSNLDAKLRVTTRAELKTLHHRLRTTTVYVTHDQAEAMTLGDKICVMYEGVIQQVAQPIEVYDRPANRFVAGFMGTPPMNFFDGKIDIKQGNAYFAIENDTVLLPDRLKDSVSSYNGKKMVLGIRPENVSFAPYQNQNQNTLVAQVQVVEPLGDRMYVYFVSSNGSRFIANVDSHTAAKTGDCIKVHIDVEKTHIFEPGLTGKNISLN